MPRRGMNPNGDPSRKFDGKHSFKLLEEAQQKLLLQFAPVLKDPSFKEMLPETPYPPLSHNVVGEYMYVLSRFPLPALPKALSQRHKRVAILAADGLPNKTIAARLKLKPSTVAGYLREIYEKLPSGSRALLARYLIALIRPTEELIGETECHE